MALRKVDRPVDKLTVLSKVEGLTALSKAERRRCLRSLLSFDLEALDRLAAYYSIPKLGGGFWRA